MRYFAITLVAILVILALCLGRPDFREETRIRNHADPIAGQMLTALSEGNYPEFSEHFDEHLRAQLSAADFQSFSEFVKQSYGLYLSSHYYSTVIYPDITLVKYIAQFSGVSGGLDITIEFSNTEGAGSVHGFSVVQAGWLTR